MKMIIYLLVFWACCCCSSHGVISQNVHHVQKRSLGKSCSFKIGSNPVEKFPNNKVFQYEHGSFRCLKFKCDQSGNVILLNDESGCEFNGECVPVDQTRSDGNCSFRICGINFKKFESSSQIEMDMYLSMSLTKCEFGSECIAIGEKKYNETNCMEAECGAIPADFNGKVFGLKTFWKPTRADCPNNGTCVQRHKMVVQDCFGYMCVSDVTENKTQDGSSFDYSGSRGLIVLQKACKMNTQCLNPGDKYKHAKCLESTCNSDGQLEMSLEGCTNFMTGECSLLGDTVSPMPCVKYMCTKNDKTYGFKPVAQGCESGDECVTIGAAGNDPVKKCKRRCIKELTEIGDISYRFGGQCL
ncbi:uncharacterized protein LOC126811459 [Patella vulgata]|uniref:uncharacterized protein LOC126811459 n=1 Tax=Patella vulgata TaxID=6465 RepID=UPI00217F447A|nr:uncharacterized protein LOC126811459 [Patella vulgata]